MFEVPGVFRTSKVEFSAASAELFIQSCMRILVIGGNGFIGSPLVSELLGSGHEVAVLHRCSDVGLADSGVVQIQGDRNRLSDYEGQLRDFLRTSSSI